MQLPPIDNRATLKNSPGTEPDVTYAYDNLGRLTSAIQTGASLAFTYDALSRKLTQVGPQGTVSSQWDIGGRRTKLTYPDGFYLDYDYDDRGLLWHIRENGAASGAGVLATFAYRELDRRASITFGNGAVTSYAYMGASPGAIATLSHDFAGTANDQTATFTYNPAAQMVGVTRTNDTYAWTGHFNENKTGTPNGLNQLTGVGPKSLTHDTKGNVTAFGTKSFTYSSENMMLTGPGSTTLSYDPAMRLQQVVSGATTRLAYDGLDRLVEYDGSNAIQRRYVFGPDMDEALVWYEGSGTGNRRFLGADERGSVTSVTDGTGTMLGINKYDEYGQPQSTNLGSFGYTGQAWLPTIGDWYYKARIQDPELGQFLQTDPLDVGDGINLYAYVGNDPVNLIDPLGLRKCAVGAVDDQGNPLPGRDEGDCPLRDPASGTPMRASAVDFKVGDPPPLPRLKKLSQCIIGFMNKNLPGIDWSKVSVSSASPLGNTWATNWGKTINAGDSFDSFERDKGKLFHELAHSPQWASGEVSRIKYLGSTIAAGMRSLGQARMGGGFQTFQQMHDSIPAEQRANSIRNSLLDAYKKAGRPCG